MKKSVVLINKNSFIYNGEEYDFDKFDEINSQLKPNIKLVILEEDLYVKKFDVKMQKCKIYNFVGYKINNDFPQNGDMLYDFEKKNNSIAIYSIKGAKRIERIVENAKAIEVKPIQFIVKEIMIKTLKNNILTCKILIKYNKYYYYISLEKGLYNYGFVRENEELIVNLIHKNNDSGEIYVDNNTIDLVSNNDKYECTEINIGELINERIYEKQRFYSRKIL